MDNINWLDFCIPCKNWCCNNEAPYADHNELNKLKIEKIKNNGDGSCYFLDIKGTCNCYDKRPLECRLFPFDIKEMDNKLFWIVWDVCKATSELNCKESVEILEESILKIWDMDYIKNYVAYHNLNEPRKYQENGFRVIKQIY
jgi:Fe-S-cluster containining protein